LYKKEIGIFANIWKRQLFLMRSAIDGISLLLKHIIEDVSLFWDVKLAKKHPQHPLRGYLKRKWK